MSHGEEESRERRMDENQCGVILGYWDHEETPTLIKDLEHSVESVERKCKNLLEDLIHYKRYLEESEEPEVRLAVFKKKYKRSKSNTLFSGSDPDIAFRKNLINLQETQEIFEEKFREKLVNINKELGAAAHKLGLKDSIVLFPAEGYLRTLRGQTEQRARKCWSEARDRFINVNRFKAKTKSDSIITDIGDSEHFSKITKNELELYQRLSRLSLRKGGEAKAKTRMTIPCKGRKIRFCCGKKCGRICEDLQKPDSRHKNSRRSGERRRTRRTRRTTTRGTGDEPPRGTAKQACQPVAKASEGEAAAEEKVASGTPMGKCVPFTACTSTSRSYNVRLNVQQLLSLTKLGGKPRVEQGGKEGRRRETVPWIPRSRSDGCESSEVSRSEHGGKMWVSKRRTLSNFRKVRSRYTGNMPGGFVEYHKSTMSQYTNGQKSMIKSESKSAYAVGSKIMVSGCQRTDVFEIDKDGGPGRRNASGDGRCNEKCAKLSMEWTKVYSSFLNTYRKYSSLKEKLSDNDSAPSNDELKSLENEIDYAIEKYKDFLQFYSKFLHLKHRLKSLKIACESKAFGPVTSFASACHRKLYACRPTSSMAMKKALKEVQALQDKIRLVCD